MNRNFSTERRGSSSLEAISQSAVVDCPRRPLQAQPDGRGFGTEFRRHFSGLAACGLL
ncbi:hypothetical protein MAXJ12_35986 [Mesorhizobium alhagi CCNWXJ12-2]|uniref:Uncharacterized protein n=1 Tax=Mesorhizobium alhagi CCNWXJ12-2 TaxID=1107882 RepID=H0I3Y0_9HYPH|nr:hypothetical protein MAXJ12_35986 [Mesorhizobium alhagi CCNWXJ12-2]